MLAELPIGTQKGRLLLLGSAFFFLLFGFEKELLAQCTELVPLEVINPSFEGPPGQHITPSPWSTCGITPDTQPGFWGVTLPPSNGSSYVGFVYGSSSWQEGASQQLSGSMQAGITYDFTIDLSATPAAGGGINPNSFCSMEVWGSNTLCVKTEMMWSSPVITHYGWQTYTVSITPSQNWTHIYFLCSCGPLGYILLDNITPLFADNPNVFITSHVDGDAETCSFNISGNVNNAVIDSVILTGNFQESPLSATMNGLDWTGFLTFNGAGNQTVTATAYYTDQQQQETCVYTDVDLNVNAPTSAFSFTEQCDGLAIPFVDASIPFGASTITDWDWNFGDGTTSTLQNPNHLYASSGIYQVTLDISTSDGCGVALTQAVEVYEIPSTDFSFNLSCEGDITNFTDATILSIGNIQSWSWDFDDGNFSSVQNPTNTYTILGVYDVSLTVTSDNGCVQTLVQQVGMYPLPVADFDFTDACLNTNFQLTDQSTIVSGSVAAWDWDFDDGNTSALQDPSNQYATDGTYNITLTVTSDELCTDAVTQTITVHPLPVSIFANDTVCGLITMPFTDGSTVTSGSITGWQWYFGDGTLSNLQNTDHVYAAGGNYEAALVVTTALGCQDSSVQNVMVYPKPDVEFIPVAACLNDANSFTDGSTVTGAQIVGWDWDFGDNSGVSVAQNPTYIYGASGQYSVTLIASTDDGCLDTISHSVDVYDLPVADFSFTDICEDDSVQFLHLSTIPTGIIVDCQWAFGNGNSANVEVPDLQLYPADGFYPVSLIVLSDFGCSDTADQTIEIFPVPIASFSFDSACFPLEIQFTDLSDQNGTYGITNWTWDFSDGQTSNLPSPSMGFLSAGTYAADLLITNGPGCKSTFSGGDAVVHPVPVADFPAGLATCFEDTIFFTDGSSIIPVTDDLIDTWNWDFDDGNTWDQPDGFHRYASYGLYNVQFEVVSNHACAHSITQMVDIYPLPTVDFAPDPISECAPLFVQFIDQTSIPHPYNLASWDWYLGNDSITDTSPNPFITYNPDLEPLDIATYDIGLTVTSVKGCVSDIFRPAYITVYPKPVAAFSVKPDVQTIISPNFDLTDLSTENVMFWDWSFGDGNYDNDQHPTHTYAAVGTYPIGLIVETQYGCLDTMGRQVKVEPKFTFYIPNSFTPDADDINDLFYGQGEAYTAYAFDIYDRWGELIFESADDQYHWDGTFRGAQVKQGTYVYRFFVTDWEGHEHQYNGIVTLHR